MFWLWQSKVAGRQFQKSQVKIFSFACFFFENLITVIGDGRFTLSEINFHEGRKKSFSVQLTVEDDAILANFRKSWEDLIIFF